METANSVINPAGGPASFRQSGIGMIRNAKHHLQSEIQRFRHTKTILPGSAGQSCNTKNHLRGANEYFRNVTRLLIPIFLLASIGLMAPQSGIAGEIGLLAPDTGIAGDNGLPEKYPAMSQSQTVHDAGEDILLELELIFSGEPMEPGETVNVMIEGISVEKLQYIGLELSYDFERFEFVNAVAGELFDDRSVEIADHMPDGTLGAAVSSTDGEVAGQGSLFALVFQIREDAPSGTALFEITYIEASDAGQNDLELTINNEVTPEIPPYIKNAGLNSPGPLTLGRGESETFVFTLDTDGIDASDITGENRIRGHMGVISAGDLPSGDNNAGTSPAEWPEQTWRDLAYTHTDDGLHWFESELPPDLETGTWYAAGRFQLDDRDHVYAGYNEQGGGFWDGEESVSVEITITPPRVLLAHWSFDREDWQVDTGLFDNLSSQNGDAETSQATFELINADFNGWSGGFSGQAANSNNWHPEQDENDNEIDKYWLAQLSGEGYGTYQVSFAMNGSNTGPRDFRLEYRRSGESWQAIPDGEIQVTNNFTEYHIVLPDETNDTAELELRWLRVGSASIDDGEIGNTGTNRMDEVRITGAPVDDTTVDVMPGDASFSGTVDASDVLEIARYWMARGPARVPQSVTWASQPVIRWVPEAAGHADTNGDGVVDYRDIMAVGRNFDRVHDQAPGKIAAKSSGAAISDAPASVASSASHPPVSKSSAETSTVSKSSAEASTLSKSSAEILKETSLPLLGNGETVRVSLIPQVPAALLGVSARFALSGIPEDDWALLETEPGSWAESWEESGRLLRFSRNNLPEYWSGAWAHQGSRAHPVTIGQPGTTGADGKTKTTGQNSISEKLLQVTIRAERDWTSEPVLQLKRLNIMDKNGTSAIADADRVSLVPEKVTGSSAEEHDKPDVPGRVRLRQNYPNPFNPETIIPYDIAEPGRVRLTVYDALGRKVATLVDRQSEPGSYEVVFDGRNHASGLYIVRLETYTHSGRAITDDHTGDFSDNRTTGMTGDRVINITDDRTAGKSGEHAAGLSGDRAAGIHVRRMMLVK